MQKSPSPLSGIRYNALILRHELRDSQVEISELVVIAQTTNPVPRELCVTRTCLLTLLAACSCRKTGVPFQSFNRRRQDADPIIDLVSCGDHDYGFCNRPFEETTSRFVRRGLGLADHARSKTR